MAQRLRKINSFSRRIGKGFTEEHKKFLAKHLSTFLFNLEDLTKNHNMILEIGFGNGEHLIDIAKDNPDHLIIGVEPFLTGVHNAIEMAVEQNISNVKIFPDDLDLIIDNLPANYFENIFVLFPDPWPKKRHYKRRILNETRILKFIKMLAPHGNLIIGSDHDDYKSWIEEKLNNISEIRYEMLDIIPDYRPTKYHQKAIREGRVARFYEVSRQ